MHRDVAYQIVGGLSRTSKMPCRSWSIDVQHCRVGSILREMPGTVCAVCYAGRNLYRTAPVQRAMHRRWRQLRWAMQSDRNRRKYIVAFATLLRHRRLFRWFDAGDVQGDAHARIILAIARLTPSTRHWVPTKERETWKRVLAWEPLPYNVVLRYGMKYVDQTTYMSRHRRYSTVHTSEGLASLHGKVTGIMGCTMVVCDAKSRASKQRPGGYCGPCRACWDLDVDCVSYPKT